MSLAIRVAIAVAALSILTAVLVTGSAIVSTSAGVRADIDDFLEERAEQIIDGTRGRPDRNGRNDRDDEDSAEAPEVIDVDEVATAAIEFDATEFDAQVQIIDEAGTITFTIGSMLPVSADAIEIAGGEGPGRGLFETITVDEVEYRIFTDDFPDGGAVQVATSTAESSSLVSFLRTRLLVLGAILATIAAVIGWFIAHRTLRPLGDLTAAAERVAQTQDLDSAIVVDNSNDEIGRLATSFNEMLEALGSSREQQHRLVQDAAHELRTPLTSVNANIDFLMHATDLPEEERREMLGGVRAELRQLGTLFTEIIELATDRRETAKHQPVDLASVANRAIDDLSRRATNPVTVDASTSMVSGDFNALHRAVTNLLGNAVKYSPDGSPIHVTVASGRISIQDSGPGIPAAERTRVFDRFHRLAESRPAPGSGLGLSIVAKIVADHGGETFIEDADPGPGAVVGFTLPSST